MIITLTAKLRLHTTVEQFQALRRTQLAHLDALNHMSRYALANSKKSKPCPFGQQYLTGESTVRATNENTWRVLHTAIMRI